jgi:hypothetical protein
VLPGRPARPGSRLSPGRDVAERDEIRMEPQLREILRGEPDIVAWLEAHECTDDDEEQTGVA